MGIRLISWSKWASSFQLDDEEEMRVLTNQRAMQPDTRQSCTRKTIDPKPREKSPGDLLIDQPNRS
jgi:hypothetical protein